MTNNEQKIILRLTKTTAHLLAIVGALLPSIPDESERGKAEQHVKDATETLQASVNLMEKEWSDE